MTQMVKNHNNRVRFIVCSVQCTWSYNILYLNVVKKLFEKSQTITILCLTLFIYIYTSRRFKSNIAIDNFIKYIYSKSAVKHNRFAVGRV